MGLSLRDAHLRDVLVLGLLLLMARFCYKWYKVRSLVHSFVKRYNLKSPPHSRFFGHLPALAKAMMKYPRDLAGQSVAYVLVKEYPEVREQGFVVLDTWPIGYYPMLAVFNPDMIAQFCQEQSQPKSAFMQDLFKNFTDGQDLVCANGNLWKRWRAIFNPGFSNKNILSLVPEFIEELEVFRDELLQHTDTGKTIRLLDPATKAACDVIGRAVLGLKLDIQTSESQLFNAMKRQLALIAVPGTLEPWRDNPIRLLRMWNNNRILRNELVPEIRRQFQETSKVGRPKTICSLAVTAYMKEKGLSADDEAGKAALFDENFISIALAQIEIFLIAGHDTTAGALCYVYWCLHNNPEVADRVRQEHSEVLGPDSSDAIPLIMSDPSVLHRLTYTTAVIKETLRLYPPVASVREGSSSFELVNPETHQRFDTKGFTIMACTHAAQRLEDYWEKPDLFLPERWLAKEGDLLYPRKHAFRPFELGPRNCIGQELASIELRLMLVLTVRDIDVIPAYKPGAVEAFGEAAYQVATSADLNIRPKDDFPVTLRRR